MRNLKRALSLTLASVMLLGMMVVGSSAASFPDVDDNDNIEAIDVLETVKVMIGNENGDFEPDKNVTRAEMAVVMAELLNLDYDYYVTSCPFNDVPDWAKGYVGACAANGIVSGRGEGVYDPSATVTAVEAASMMMRALGYFKNSKDYEPNFEAATVKQASEISLFSGINSNAKTPLTRNQVAKLALNALEANMVTFTGDMGIEIPGVGVVGYRAEYTYRTGTEKKYAALSSLGDTTDVKTGSNVQGRYYIQLGEELYNGKLTKNSGDEDAFNRSATTWRYDYKVIGTYMNDADLTYSKAVKLSDIYKDLGLGKTVDPDNVAFYRNGRFETEGAAATRITDNSTSAVLLADLGLSKNTDNKIGGNGVLTQVWYDKATESARITMVDTYVGKVATTVKATGSAARYITLSNTSSPYFNVTNNKFETEKFASNDLVIFTAALNDKGRYDIQAVEDLELSTTATLEKWEGGSVVTDDKGDANANFTAGGVKYDYSAFRKVVDDEGSPYTIEQFDVGTSEVNVYLDKYGYAIYISGVEGEKNYAAVIGVGSQNTHGSETKGVTLLLPDGTIKEVTAKMDNWEVMSGINSSTVGNLTGSNVNLVVDGIADIVTYSVGDDNVYKLTLAADKDSGFATGKYSEDAKNDATSFVNGKSLMEIWTKFADKTDPAYTAAEKGSYYTTSKTIFMVATQKDSTKTARGDIDDKGYNYNVYVGYANAPGIKARVATDTTIHGMAFALNNYYKNQIDVVYIDARVMDGVSAAKTYFVLNHDEHKITTNSDGKYYTLPAIVEGEETTIMIDAKTKSDWNSDGTPVTLDTAPNGVYAIQNVLMNKKNIITDCDQVKGGVNNVFASAMTPAVGTVEPNKEVVGIGGAFYAYNDSTKVYVVDKDYKGISVSSVADIQTDSDDLVYAALTSSDRDKKLTDVIIVAQEPTVTYTVGKSANVEINNSSNFPAATPSDKTYSENTTVYVKAAAGYVIDADATKANGLTLSAVSGSAGVYSFKLTGDVAQNVIVAKSDGSGPVYATGVVGTAVNAPENLNLADTSDNEIAATGKINVVDGISFGAQVKTMIAAQGYTLDGVISRNSGDNGYEFYVIKDDVKIKIGIADGAVTTWYPITDATTNEVLGYTKASSAATLDLTKATGDKGLGVKIVKLSDSSVTYAAYGNNVSVGGAASAYTVERGYVQSSITANDATLTSNFAVEYYVNGTKLAAKPEVLKPTEVLTIKLKASKAVKLFDNAAAEFEVYNPTGTAPTSVVATIAGQENPVTLTSADNGKTWKAATGAADMAQNDIITVTYAAANATNFTIALKWTDAK